MPELPEVETVRRDLDRLVAGRTITAVQVTGTRTVRRGTARALTDRLVGATVTGARRRGKYLVLPLGSGDWLVIHLRMSGQLLRAEAEDPVAKHTHVVIELNQGGELRFVDPRTFGEVFVTHPDRLTEEAPALEQLGWDPLDEPMAWVDFGRRLLARRQQLKAYLMDQTQVAGLGNIYSDEILHAAGLRYDRATDSLTPEEIRRLFRAVLETVNAAVAARGSTLGDEQYVDLQGRPGTFQREHQVYGRAGEPCHRCRATVVRARYQGRSTFFCPACQV